MSRPDKTMPAPPLSPDIAAYEPGDLTLLDEPLFEQLHLTDIETWPAWDSLPWRFDTSKLERATLISKTIPSFRVWDSIFVRCDLSGSKFFGASLLRAELLGCRGVGVQLGKATIKNVSFQNCKLSMANFRQCKLERVVFENCILDDADFNDATLTDVVFTKCELNRTEFSGTKSLRTDMTNSDISSIRGVKSLKNVRIRPEQMLEIAPLLCSEIGITVVE